MVQGELVIAGPTQEVVESHFLSMKQAAAGAVLALVALTGCSAGGESDNNADATPTVSAAANEACPDGSELDAVYNDTEMGTGNSPYPLLTERKVKDGQSVSVLVSNEKAQELLQNNNCNNTPTLALAKSLFVDTRENAHFPNEGTLGQVVANYKDIMTNGNVAQDSLNNVTDAFASPDFLEPTDEFAVTKGQATVFEITVDAQGNFNGFRTRVLKATGSLEGFKLGFDAEKVTDPDQKALYNKLKELILITKDGKIVINETLGNKTFKFDVDADVTVSPTDSPSGEPLGAQPSPTDGPAPGGVTEGDQGCGNAGEPDCAGGPGSGPEGPEGPGPGTPTTPNTPPTHPPTHPPTQPPPTHPPTHPPTQPPPTHPPTHPPTQPPTPSETPKGSEPPCVPNPPEVVCP